MQLVKGLKAAFKGGIETGIQLIEGLIGRAVLPLGCAGLIGVDDGVAGGGHIGVHPGAHTCQDGRTQSGPLLGRLGGLDGAAQHIGEHLPPEGGASAAAAGHDMVGGHTHLPQNVQTLALGVGHPLQHRTDEIPPTMHGGQADKGTSGLLVQQRGPLAHQVGQIEQPVGSNGGLSRLPGHDVVGIHPLRLSLPPLLGAELVAEPLEGQAGGQGTAHHRPCSGYGGAEGMDPSAGIDAHLVGVGKDHAGGTQGHKGPAGPHHAGTHCRCGVVTGATRHRCTGGQAGLGSGGRRHRAGEVGGLIQLAQQSRVDVQLVQHLLGPAAVSHVQQVHARGVGHLGGKLSRQLVAQVVLGQQDAAAFCK